MSQAGQGPDNHLGARLRRALIEEAERMETRWMIARLRRLVDLLEAEAIKSSEYADKDTSATRASVNDGRSLAYTRAAMLVKEILGDLVREATHLR